MKITELQVENVKRVRAVRIRPDGSLVIIGGKNGAGKSSVLDSIEMALGGGKTLPPDPVRRGARKAKIVADLGDLVVERTITNKGTQLVVRNADGVEQRSPQALLDALCTRIAFDPLSFAREKPDVQDRILKELMGLDFTDIEERRRAAFDSRKLLNRELHFSEGRVRVSDGLGGRAMAQVMRRRVPGRRGAHNPTTPHAGAVGDRVLGAAVAAA